MAEPGNFLEGRRILLVSPRFFGYEEAIQEEIARLGGRVDYIDERPGNDFSTKACIRLRPGLLRARTRRHYTEALDSLPGVGDYDQVLVISPEAMDTSLLRLLRARIPRAEFVLYLWDSLRNKAVTTDREFRMGFDRQMSFDPEECRRFPELRYRPLFFRKEYEDLPRVAEDAEYDLAFIGTVYGTRFALCRVLREKASALGLKAFFYLYFPDRRLYWLNRMTNPAMAGAKAKDFSFVPLSIAAVVETVRKSRCIVDIHHPRQAGMTIRTLEALGAGRKLLSTNRIILASDFYMPDNHRLIGFGDLVLDPSFLRSPYVPVDPTVYRRHSLAGWLREVLG